MKKRRRREDSPWERVEREGRFKGLKGHKEKGGEKEEVKGSGRKKKIEPKKKEEKNVTY